MDKFVKRIQSRLKYNDIIASKAECREAFERGIPQEDWDNPSDDQIAEVVDWFIRGQEIQDDLDDDEATDLVIPQPETFQIAQENPDIWQILQPSEQEPAAMTVAEPALPTEQPIVGLSPTEIEKAVSKAIAQTGETGNEEAMQIMTSLVSQLTGEINTLDEAVTALVAGYLNKRSNILTSAMGTLNSIRSNQTSSFCSGLNTDFFAAQETSREQLMKIANIFN